MSLTPGRLGIRVYHRSRPKVQPGLLRLGQGPGRRYRRRIPMVHAQADALRRTSPELEATASSTREHARYADMLLRREHLQPHRPAARASVPTLTLIIVVLTHEGTRNGARIVAQSSSNVHKTSGRRDRQQLVRRQEQRTAEKPQTCSLQKRR